MEWIVDIMNKNCQSVQFSSIDLTPTKIYEPTQSWFVLIYEDKNVLCRNYLMIMNAHIFRKKPYNTNGVSLVITFKLSTSWSRGFVPR